MPGQASTDASRPHKDSGLHTSPGMPEAVILCPQPRKAFPPPLSNPSSPGDDAASRVTGYGPDEARNELREVFHEPRDDEHGGVWKKTPADRIDHRPLSGVSTSAGATPGPESRASPHPWPPTPDSNASPGAAAGGDAGYLGKGGGRRLSLSGIGAGSGSEGSAKSEARDAHGAGGVAGGGPPKQAGKVFVGGVPQDMNQDDLYTIFNEYGHVKKAWLQSYRTAGRVSNQSPPHNHRGFGFVIFYDGSAVDALLGKDFSKFLTLEGGRRLEVKKAVPSSDLPGKPPPHTSSVVGRIGASTAGAAIYHRSSVDAFPQMAKAVDNTRPAQLAPAALLGPSTQMVQTATPWPPAQQAPTAPSDWQWFRSPQMPAAAVQYPADMRVAGYPMQAAAPTPFTSPAPQPAAPWPTYMAAASPAQHQQQQQQQQQQHAQPMMMAPNCVPNAAQALQPAQSMMLAPVQWQGGYSGFMQPIAPAPMQHQQQQAVGMQMGLQQQQHAFHQQQQAQMQQLTLHMQPVQVSNGSRILDS